MSNSDAPSKKVVGPDAKQPGCNDILFVLLFLGNVALVVAFFAAWLGDGAQGFPVNSTRALIEQASHPETQLNNIVTTTGITCGYTFLFA